MSALRLHKLGALFALVVLSVIAFAVRWLPARELELDAQEAHELGTRWLIDDPQTAYHLRRVELTLAAHRTPYVDSFLSHPAQSEIPWLPMYDTLLAALAEPVLQSPEHDPALGGVDEAALEDFLVHLPPFLGVLVVWIAFWAVRESVTGRARPWAPYLGAALYAVAPITVAQCELARLDAMSWVVLLALVQMGLTAKVLKAREPFDAVLGAMVLGAVAGILLASFTLAIALFAASWIGFVVLAYGADVELRPLGQRAGLLFCVVACFVSQVPLGLGPSEPAAPTLLAQYHAVAAEIVLFAALPFVVAFFLPGRRPGRPLQTLSMLFALGVLVYYAPTAVQKLVVLCDRYSEGIEGLARVTPGFASLYDSARGDGVWSVLRKATPLGLLVLPALFFLARHWKQPIIAFVLAATVAALALSCFQVRCLALVIVVLPMGVGLACDGAVEASIERLRPLRIAAIACTGVILGAHAIAPCFAGFSGAEREQRIEFVKGLRWMRAHTPAPGAWNASATRSDWGVLSIVSVGHLVHYHARRPTLVSELGCIAGSGPIAEWWWTTLALDDPRRLVRILRERLGAYVVVAPRFFAMRELRDEEVGAGDARGSPHPGTPRASILRRLALTRDPASDASLADFERVYASPRRVTPEGLAPTAGDESGPAISIYRVDDSRPLSPAAEINAR